MSLHITNTALVQIKKNLEIANKNFLRVGIKKSGCSGFMYFLDFADSIQPSDMILNHLLVEKILLKDTDLNIITDIDCLPMLEGVTLDYVKQGLNQTFKFSNPKATAECGCGESFSL